MKSLFFLIFIHVILKVEKNYLFCINRISRVCGYFTGTTSVKNLQFPTIPKLRIVRGKV